MGRAVTQQRIREALIQLALTPRKLAKSLSGLMPAAAQGLTVMALDGQWLKLLQVDGPPSNRRILKLAAYRVEGTGPEALAKTFTEACAAEGLTPQDILVANPTHLCTVRLFSLPSTDPKEIRDIVELQAEKHTPYAKEEILTDFTIVDRDRSGYSRVLMVIAHQDVIHRSVRLIEGSGFTLERVGCELEGLVNWARLVKRSGGTTSGATASLVVEVDGSTTTLIVMERGQLRFHRSLATGAEQLQDDPDHAGERLVGELQRSLEAVEAEGGTAKVQEVLLPGRIERLGPLKTLIEQGLDLPVHLIAPWANRDISESLRAAWERLPDVSCTSLIGLALDASAIDLTPQQTKLHQAFEARAKALVLLGCQGVAALILVSLLFIGEAQKQERYYQKLRIVYQKSAKETARVEEALAQLEFVKERLRLRAQLLDAVDTLAQHSPPEIKWESLSFAQGEELLLKGVSEQLPKVYEFVASLGESPLFGQVEAKRVAKGKSGEQDVTAFEISCPLIAKKKAVR